MELTGSLESPTRSRSIRACASSRSSGVNQEVVRGCVWEEEKSKDGYDSGNCAFTAMQVRSCTESEGLNTNRMNNHRQPAIPRSPSIPAKTPAAIKPEKPVARICAQ
jgi:hypothetical protein